MSDNSHKSSNSNPLTTPGQLLFKERVKLAMDAKQVSDALKITCGKLAAIEADNYDIFPSSIYVRGHLRHYARLVNISEAEIMDCYYAYIDSIPRNVLEATNKADKEIINVGNFARALAWWPYSLVAVLVVSWIVVDLFFTGFTGHDSQQQIADEPKIVDQTRITDEADAVEAPSPSIDLSPPTENILIENVFVQRGDKTADSYTNNKTIDSKDTAGKRTDTKPTEIKSIDNKNTSSETSVDSSVTDNPATTQSIPVDTTNTPVIQDITTYGVDGEERVIQSTFEAVHSVQENTESDQLVLSFTDDCWVEVIDASGRELAAKLYRAGDRLVLRGNAPFDIMLGNVRVAEIHLNGKAIVVRPIDNRRTLRFMVGNNT